MAPDHILLTDMGEEAVDLLERADEIVAQSEESSKCSDLMLERLVKLAAQIHVDMNGHRLSLLDYLVYKYGRFIREVGDNEYEVDSGVIPFESEMRYFDLPRKAVIWLLEFTKTIPIRKWWDAEYAYMYRISDDEVTIYDWWADGIRERSVNVNLYTRSYFEKGEEQ